jgi:hypothetical protein
VIQEREATANTEVACAVVVCATEASAWEVVAVRESAVAFLREAEARATLAMREAQERVSQMEAESAATLASTYGEAEGFVRRIALLEGELSEECQAHDTIEENSQNFSDMTADIDQLS